MPDPPIYQGIDWGIDNKTPLKTGVFADIPQLLDTIPFLGAVCTKEERTMSAGGGNTINKTYTVAETLYHPGLITQLENLMTGGTIGADAWGQWSAQVTGINSTDQAANYAWYTWVDNTATIKIQMTAQSSAGTSANFVNNQFPQDSWGNWVKKTHETEAQKKKRIDDQKAREALWLEEEKRLQAQQNKVKVRAEKILVRHLSTDQAATLKENGYFDVDLADKVYRIWRGTHGNIKELSQDKTKEVASLCVQPNGVPTEDVMLAQLLWLRADEKALLRVANRTVLRT